MEFNNNNTKTIIYLLIIVMFTTHFGHFGHTGFTSRATRFNGIEENELSFYSNTAQRTAGAAAIEAVRIIDVARLKRQVVQPDWLRDKDDNRPQNSKVQVNAKSLKEAADIRKAIQSAVDEDRFAVPAANAADFQQAAEKIATDIKKTPGRPVAPCWFCRTPFFPQFTWPFGPNNGVGSAFSQQAKSAECDADEEVPSSDWEAMWKEFMENSKRFFSGKFN